ncbi:MAG: DUF4175 family protein [Candidatus Limimorpha sp.]
MDKSFLSEKIERFIRKYYLNRLIHSGLIGLVLMIVFYLIINGIEFFSWLPQKGRLVLLILSVCISAFILLTFIILPLSDFLRFKKIMSEKEAAIIIGKFFPEISDKLLNTIQLSDNLNDNPDNELLLATIQQRTESLRPFDFSNVVDLKGNLKILRIFILAFVILSALTVFLPNFSKEPAMRIINYKQHFEKPLPFDVELSDLSLETTQGSDVEFRIHVKGEQIPDMFFIKSSNGTKMMKKINNNDFQIIFKNVKNNEEFYVEGGDYRSQTISLIVRPNPTLLSYETRISFPKYINRENETINGKTRVMVPEGSTLSFKFFTKDADSVFIVSDTMRERLESAPKDCFVYSFKATKTTAFSVHTVNTWNKDSEPIPFTVNVIPDAYPEIQVQDFREDFSKRTFYSGLIADDYGFTRLLYHFRVEGKPSVSFVKPISIDKRNTRGSFFYSIDLDTIKIDRGDKIQSYFEIFDNDGVNGPKSKQSEVFYFTIPTAETLDSVAKSTENQILEQLSNRSDEIQRIRQDIDEMLRELMSKKELDWNDKDKIKELLEKQKEIQEEWDKIKEEQRELSNFMKENDLYSEELIKKQDEINKLFDEVIPDEMKKMIEEIEKMLGEMPLDKMQNLMKEMKKNNESLQEMMNRNLSLLEQLKVEKDMYELIDDMNKLAEKLTGETDSIKADEAWNEFNSMQNRLDSILDKNHNLESPFNIDKDEEAADEINEDLKDAEESESSNNGQRAKEKKQDAGNKMREMAEDLSMQMMSSGMEQLAEDAHLVRILLENVVRSSHDEEALMNDISIMKKDDPSISQKISRQKEISDNFVMVEDSLRKMAMRQTMIKDFVFKELQVIDQQLGTAMQDILELRLSTATSKQQNAMMSMNNLALMLSESLKEMDSQMQSMSNSSCSKQGNSKNNKGKPQSMKNMKDLQKQLGEQLKKMQQQMQQMQKDGKPTQTLSEELVRMAAEQELIREGMQKILDEMKKNGILEDDGINDIIKEMDKLEEDIVNKRINNQTIRRNKEIMSRMLKAENAQQEREKDEKRKSDEYKGKPKTHSIDELRYEESKNRQQDFLRYSPIEYQQYYKTKINEYFFRNK